MILQDFFVSGLSPSEPTNEPTTTTAVALEKKPSVAPAKAPPPKRTNLDLIRPADSMSFVSATTPVDNDVETQIEIIVKNPQVILLEDQRNSNSNCLVLDVSLSFELLKRSL